MQPSQFLFGRLNLIAQFEDKEKFILSGLLAHHLRHVREHLWGFFDIEIVSSAPTYVTGYLTKLHPEYVEEIGDLKTHEIELAKVANRAVAKARFFLDIPTGLIAYQVIGGHIRQHIFEEQFVRVFEESHENFFVSAEIQTVEARESFLDALASLDRIGTVVVELHPTNPHYDELYRSVDERLKAMKAKKYKEVYSAAPEGPGLEPVDDPEFRQKAIMAEDGYGYATALGFRDGKPVRVATNQNPITERVVTKDRTPSEILADLMEGFAAIVGRIAQ